MPITNEYDIGDKVRLSATFRDSAEALADPDTVILKVKAPGAAVVTYTYLTDPEIARDGVGQFHADISITGAGVWRYRWSGTGTIEAAEEGSFLVATSDFV